MSSALRGLFSAPYKWFRHIIGLRERHPVPCAAVVGVVCFVGFARTELELLSTYGGGGGGASAFVNNAAFYLQATYLYGALAAKLARRELDRVTGVVLIGVFLGIFPPIIDVALGNFGKGYYRYVSDGLSSWNFSLINPKHYSTGEALVLWSSVLLLGGYVAEVTRSWAKALLALAGSYLVTTLIAIGPSSVVDWVLRDARPFEPQRFYLASLTFLQLIAAQVAYLFCRPALARRLSKRLLHALPFVALTLLGNALSNWLVPGPFSAMQRVHYAVGAGLAIFQLCVIALVQNDAFDLAEDVARVPGETTREDAYVFSVVGLLFVLAVLMASPPVGTPLALFLIVSTLYSFDFYRAKRFFPSNYKIEGVWAWSAFVLGGTASHLVFARPQRSGAFMFASLLVFGGWFTFCVFKDYKDIRADFRARNQTLYVLSLRRGFPLRRLHLALRGAFVFSLLVVPGLLALRGLPWLPLASAGVLGAGAAYYVLGRPPRGSTVRAFLWLVSGYVTALSLVVEFCR